MKFEAAFKNAHLCKSDPFDVVAEAIAVIISFGTSRVQKRAAMMILRILCREELLSGLFGESDMYPISRHDRRVVAWAEDVKARGRCEECGSKDRLEAHHVLRWSEYPPGRVDPANGQCLCLDCHAKAHGADSFCGMIGGKLHEGVERTAAAVL